MDSVQLCTAVLQLSSTWQSSHGLAWVGLSQALSRDASTAEVLYQLCQDKHNAARLANGLVTNLKRHDAMMVHALVVLNMLTMQNRKGDFMTCFSGASGAPSVQLCASLSDDLNHVAVGSRRGPRSASGCSGGGGAEHVRGPGASQARMYETRWLGVTRAMTPPRSCQCASPSAQLFCGASQQTGIGALGALSGTAHPCNVLRSAAAPLARAFASKLTPPTPGAHVCWTTASGVNAIHALYALARVAAVLDPPGQRCWAEQGAMLGPALWRLLLVRPAWSASIVVPAVPPADCIDMSSLFTAPDGRPPHP